MGARLRSSFPHAPGGNPGSSSSLDPRQEHAGVTECTLSCIARNSRALETAFVPTLTENIRKNDLFWKRGGRTEPSPWLPWCAPKHTRKDRDSARARLVLSAANSLNPCQPADSRRPRPIAAKNCLPVGAVLVFQPTIDVFPAGIVVRPMYYSTFTIPFILTVENYSAAFL
jgi:hypothetical protein